MAFTLRQVVEAHWRRLDSAELISPGRAGGQFEDEVPSEPLKKRKKPAA